MKAFKNISNWDFNLGLWLAIQYLVADADEPTYATELVRISGLSYSQMVELQESSRYKNRIMRRFIKDFKEDEK